MISFHKYSGLFRFVCTPLRGQAASHKQSWFHCSKFQIEVNATKASQILKLTLDKWQFLMKLKIEEFSIKDGKRTTNISAIFYGQVENR